jgi:8-oxo-dGTP pyrophosphatase MutT (NUDIX family)
MVLEETLRSRLALPLPGAQTHLRFAPTPHLKQWDPAATPPEARRAAALMLIYPGSLGPTMALTLRRADLPHHGGQISLPGGGMDAGESPVAAALRETHEELGVDPAIVRVAGSLSTLWVIVSGFVVHPIVGFADERPAFVPSPHEVDTIIEAPLSDIRNAANVQWGRRIRAGMPIVCPFFCLGEHQVWGATAMMLGEFCTALEPGFAPPPQPAAAELDTLPGLR